MAAWQVSHAPELVPFGIDDKQFKEKLESLAQVLYTYCCQLGTYQEVNEASSIAQNSLSTHKKGKKSHG